jgi:hypothetical protein
MCNDLTQSPLVVVFRTKNERIVKGEKRGEMIDDETESDRLPTRERQIVPPLLSWTFLSPFLLPHTCIPDMNSLQYGAESFENITGSAHNCTMHYHFETLSSSVNIRPQLKTMTTIPMTTTMTPMLTPAIAWVRISNQFAAQQQVRKPVALVEKHRTRIVFCGSVVSVNWQMRPNESICECELLR